MKIKVRNLKTVLPLIEGKTVGFDVETQGLGIDDKICLMQFYDQEQDIAFVCPVLTKEYTADEQDIAELKRIYPTLTLVGSNLQFDMAHVLREFGIFPAKVDMDTYIFSRMIQSQQNGLKDLIVKYFPKYTNIVAHFEEVAEITDKIVYSLHDKQVVRYAALDPFFSVILADHFRRSHIYEKLEKVNRLECDFLFIAAQEHAHGLRVDVEKYKSSMQEMSEQLEKLQMEFFQLAGRSVKIHSPADLRKLLYEEMGLPVTETTKTGAPATNEDALNNYRGIPLVDVLLELKHYDSVYRSSLKLPEALDSENYIHPRIEQIGYDGTSRVYSSNPSINQYPKELRECIIPADGKKFVYFDFSSAEPVITAHWSKCQVLIDAFREGKDIHSFIASKLLQKDQISKEDRDVSKIVNLAVTYGSEGDAVRRALKCTDTEARELVARYYETFPEIKRLGDTLRAKCRETTYTRTYMGRLRRLPNIKSMSASEVAKAERQVFNTAIQGSCADFFKMACIRTLKYRSKGVRLLFGVFDSFLLEVPQEMTEQEYLPIIDDMCSVAPWKFRCSYAEGSNWREVQEKC